MKANKFVEKFGWRDAISCIKSCAKPEERWIMHWGSLVADSDFDELKRLVESYDLVQSIGGLDRAKFYLCVCLNSKVDMVKTKGCIMVHKSMLKQAIADVEIFL